MGASWHRLPAQVKPLFQRDLQVAGADLAPREDMPVLSGTNLFAGLLFSSVGFIGFIYGKRLSLWKPMFLGLALMAYPYFIEDTMTLCLIGLVGSAALFLLRN